MMQFRWQGQQCPKLFGYLQCGWRKSTTKERETHRYRTNGPSPHGPGPQGVAPMPITAYSRGKDNSSV